MPSKRGLILLSWCLGLVSISTQVVVVRELLTVFTGNELTIATSFAFWLLSVAAGCLVLRRPIARLAPPVAAGVLFVVAGVAAPLELVAIRLLHPLTVTLGEIPGPGVVLAVSAVGITPCALALGGLFVAIVRLADRSKARSPIAVVYGAEALGSGVGGLLLSAFLLESVNPVAIATLAGIASLLGGTYLLGAGGQRKLLPVLPLLACLTVGLAASRRLDLATRRSQLRPLDVVETDDTRYGNVIVTERDGVHDFFENGVLAFTVPDPMYAEECVHIPLLHHPCPRTVLDIGGAGSGIVREVAKHRSVAHLDYVEMDPAEIETVARYSPPGWFQAEGMTVSPIYGDGRRYMALTPETYDVVIVNVGMPVTLQMNRYYTIDFFQLVKSHLNPDGLMALKIPSEGAYVGPELASLLAALINSCRQVFGEVGVIPGEYIHILASPRLDIGRRTRVLLETLSERALDNSYVTRYVLWDRLSPLRAARLDSTIARYDQGKSNTDLMPISFSYSIALWAKHFKSGRVISLAVSRFDMPSGLVLIVLLGLVVVGIHLRVFGAGMKGLPQAAAIYSMGMTTMFTEVLIVLAFQIVSGYIYAGIAAIIAAFMMGMGLASSAAGARGIRSLRPSALPVLHCGLAVMPVAVIGVLCLLKSHPHFTWPHGPDIIFAALALVTGALGGGIFAVASMSMPSRGRDAADAGALSYSLDLAGASVAGFVTGLLIVPSLGLVRSAYTLSVFNAIALIPIILGWKFLRRVPSR